MSRLVVVAPGAGRSGPTGALLGLLSWLRARPGAGIEADVVLLEGGPALDELRALAPVRVVGVDDLDGLLPAPVYLTDPGAVAGLSLLPFTPERVVTHVHDLHSGFELRLDDEDRAAVLDRSDRLLAGSPAIARMLTVRHGAPQGSVAVVPAAMEAGTVPAPVDPADEEVRVLGTGDPGWAGGVDLFAQVARLAAERGGPPLRFTWVGAGDGSGPLVHAVGQQPDLGPWIAASDIVVLPARELPPPRASLGAAAAGVPTVCFGPDGVTDLVEGGAGVVVPFPDVRAMADAVVELAADADRRRRLGAEAARRAAAHHGPDVVWPLLLNEVFGTEPEVIRGTGPSRTCRRAPWVFLSHTLEQVGPPVMLGHLLGWMARHTDRPAVVVSLEPGPMADVLSEVAEVMVLGGGGRRPADGPLRREIRRSGLVHVNTVLSGRALDALDIGGAPVVTHVHELEVGLDYHLDPHDLARVRGVTADWIAASQAVADNLIRRHGVAPAKVAVHHEMIEIDERPPLTTASQVREALHVPAGAPVVGTAAVVNWRKGPDLFLRVAWLLTHRYPDLGAHLVWVGGAPGREGFDAFRSRIRAAGLDGVVHLAPAVDRPLDWMRAFDVFALPAREDAYPLACLEAASVGVPTVCFDSGGMPEFVQDDAGAVVAYPDVEAFAAAVAGLLGDPASRAMRGATAAARVRERHDVERAAPALFDHLSRVARP